MGQDTSLPSITPGVIPTTNQAINQVLLEINKALNLTVPLTTFSYFQTFVTSLRADFDTINTNINALTTNNNSVSQASSIASLQTAVGNLQGSTATLLAQIGSGSFANLQTSLTNLQTSLSSITSNIGSINLSDLSTSVSNNITSINQLQINLVTKVDKSTTINNKPLSTNITLTSADIGLDQVSNITPLNLPISNLTQTSLNTKTDKINLPIGATVGSATNIPVITYNTQGQITNTTSIPVSVSASTVGLSNVKNIDTTNLVNTTIVSAFTPLNQPIATADNGFVVAQKTQGQLNNKINLVTGTTNNILQIGTGGQIKDSGVTLNDSLNSTTNILSASAVNTLINNALSGVLDIQGSWNASNNLFPTFGSDGPIKKGYFWYVSTAGMLGSKAVQAGDSFFATIDAPGQFETNWSIIDTNLGFVPENITNKTSTELNSSLTQYPSCFSVKNYVDNAVSNSTIKPSDSTNYFRGDLTWATLNSTSVGLSNVTNTAQLKRSANDYASFPLSALPNVQDTILLESSLDGTKKTTTFNNLPMSNATSTAINLLVPKSTTINAKPLTGNLVLNSNDIGLGNVSNVSSIDLPISNATQTSLNTKVNKINLPSSGKVGSAVSIPIIDYNEQGQITSATSVDLVVSSTAVGLGNVQNIDTTDIQNVKLNTSLQPINSPITANDSGVTIAAKTQGQINALIPQIYPVTIGGIPIEDANGKLTDSGKYFDDASSTTSAIISSSAVDSRISTAITNKFNYRGMHDASTALYPSETTVKLGDLWIVSYSGLIDSRYIMNGSAIIALIDNPAQQSSKWGVLQGGYNFTPLTTDAQDKTTFTLNGFNYPSSSLVKSYVDTSINNINNQGQLMPIGAIIAYYGLTAPTGWLLCNGDTFDQSVYTTLYTLLGSNTLPNLSDYFLRGKSTSRAIGSIQTATTAMPINPFVTQTAGTHTHTLTTNTGISGTDAITSSSGTGSTITTTSSGDHTHIITGGDTETRPMNIAVNYIIKALFV